MTVEDIKKEIERMQGMAKGIKLETGLLRADINKLEGCIKQDGEAADEAYQRGYEEGFKEGRTRKELSEEKDKSDDVIRVGDEVITPLSGRFGRAVVTKVISNPNDRTAIDYMYSSGAYGWEHETNLRKTGRHFDQVEELLKEMRK